MPRERGEHSAKDLHDSATGAASRGREGGCWSARPTPARGVAGGRRTQKKGTRFSSLFLHIAGVGRLLQESEAGKYLGGAEIISISPPPPSPTAARGWQLVVGSSWCSSWWTRTTRDAQPRIRVTYSGCGRHAANARLAVLLTLSEPSPRQRRGGHIGSDAHRGAEEKCVAGLHLSRCGRPCCCCSAGIPYLPSPHPRW